MAAVAIELVPLVLVARHPQYRQDNPGGGFETPHPSQAGRSEPHLLRENQIKV